MRVGMRCSNPHCQRLTSGPTADPSRSLSIGVCAHITAASQGGPRFDERQTAKQRRSAENAIWLCQSCGTLVDRDTASYTVSLLKEWKQRAEDLAARDISAGSRYRPLAATEIRQELSVAELVVIRALEDEFGCHVETEVLVPAGDGWLRLQGAVVRGEDLVAVDIRENHGRGIPYFQIEHLLNLCATLHFSRFRGCVVYIAVVSDGPPEADPVIRERLEEIIKSSALECYIRMYRLNALRARYGL